MATDYLKTEDMVQDSAMDISDSGFKTSSKSFKKKYRKMRVKFEQDMNKSNEMFKEELNLHHLSRRLKEQNDQLLDLLLELNECVQVPRNLRFDLKDPGSPTSSVAPSGIPSTSHDLDAYKATLKEARTELAAGEMSPNTYRGIEKSLLEAPTFAPTLSLANLRAFRQTSPGSTATEDENELSGYLDPMQEAEFLNGIDARLGMEPIGESADRELDLRRETALKNPVSVYNWLRKNHPQVFLQDSEAQSVVEKPEKPEKPAPSRPAANSRSTKRTSVASMHNTDEPGFDDEAIMMEIERSTGKGKRKREEDEGYRPKGGSSRPRKKREETAGAAEKKKEAYGSRRGRRTAADAA